MKNRNFEPDSPGLNVGKGAYVLAAILGAVGLLGLIELVIHWNERWWSLPAALVGPITLAKAIVALTKPQSEEPIPHHVLQQMADVKGPADLVIGFCCWIAAAVLVVVHYA